VANIARIGLDNPAFYGRLKRPDFSSPINRSLPPRIAKRSPDLSTRRQEIIRPTKPIGNYQNPINSRAVSFAPASKMPLLDAEAFSSSQPIKTLKVKKTRRFLHKPNYSRSQWLLMSLAFIVLLIGLGVSYQAYVTNRHSAQQISVLSKQVDKQSSSNGSNVLPSTTKPSAVAIKNYVVASDLPRYIRIPKIGVFARVLQVGVTSTGNLGTPPDIYDTAWYNGSNKPGQPGATLIDGHVSSWTSKGVFYSIKNLVAGDFIQIQKGDGSYVDYHVVKTVVYNSNDVDMQAAVLPINPSVPGLNLITCTGQVIKGTSLFNKRVIVFAEQIGTS